jgi:hypothetical protein
MAAYGGAAGQGVGEGGSAHARSLACGRARGEEYMPCPTSARRLIDVAGSAAPAALDPGRWRAAWMGVPRRASRQPTSEPPGPAGPAGWTPPAILRSSVAAGCGAGPGASAGRGARAADDEEDRLRCNSRVALRPQSRRAGRRRSTGAAAGGAAQPSRTGEAFFDLVVRARFVGCTKVAVALRCGAIRSCHAQIIRSPRAT